jgi:hypothetical protein
VFIGQGSTRQRFPMLRACSSNGHELSNGLLKRHSWTAIEAVNVPAKAMVETTVPKGGPTQLVAATRNQNKSHNDSRTVVRVVGRYETVRSMIYH